MGSRRTSSRIVNSLISGFVLCLFAVNGLNAASCKLGCPYSDSGLTQYTPGNVYEYSIDSLMTVGISGNDADETSLKISGQAKLFAEGNCGYTLQLEQITVTALKESVEKQIIQSLNKPVKFILVSGELQPEICVDSSDTVASLNIKRGIISLLHISDKPRETDVFGVCPTLTSSSKTGSGDIITKVRNLNSCAYREQISNGLITGVVNSNAGIKSSSILNADYTKEVKLARGLVESVQLIEEYKFAALANTVGAARAKVRTTLKLGKVGKANAPQIAGESKSIIFEKPSTISVKNIAVLKKVFTTTVGLVNEHVQGDAAQYFTELIRLMRSSDTDTLIELSVVPHVNKVLARKVYLDALFRVGTSNAVKAIVRQVSKMSETEKKLAFLSFNLVQFVEKDALNQAATLINPNSPKEAFLAIGNLVNKYCKQGTCDQSELNIVSKKFTDNLKHCKSNTKKDEDRFVNILKGIRNTHKIADLSIQVLTECASSERSARLRVAALQAFTAAACDTALQTKALSILKDLNEDSEIRIEAYLAAIACPNAELANEIAEIVNNEPVYQVGGFIVSSLKAIRDSTDPTREASRHYLSNIRVTKKFPLDPRRFSFNNEISYAVESLGLSASADYSLIYSQKGYLPRSARLNLTSELFGSNFNILEINARQENLEEVLGYYFGPKGYFNSEDANLRNLANKLRSKRSIADDTGKFAKKYKSYGSKSSADINLDLAIRIFGSELLFLSLADDVPQTIDDILKKSSESTEQFKTNLKKYENEYACHALFLDTEYTYTTGVGLPLELSVQGTSASKLNIATEIDVDAIVQDPGKTKYRIKLVPSVDVNVNGQLRFNALVLVAGLRTSTSLQSSTGSDVRFEIINEATGFNLDIAFPRENLQLVIFKHNVEFVISEQEKETKVLTLKQKKKKNTPQETCFDQLHYIGMTLCFNSLLPDVSGANSLEGASSPFAGPLYVAVNLQTEKNINLIGTYKKSAESRQLKLRYSTPGSQVPHDTEFNVQIGNQPNIYILASLVHPEIRLSGEAGVKNDDKEISLYGKYGVNDEITVQKIGLTKNGDEYRPLIEIKSNNGVSNEIGGYKADGRIVQQDSRFVFENLQLISKDDDRLVVNGWTDVKPFKSELTVQSGADAYEIKSHFSLDDETSVGLFFRNKNSPNLSGASFTVQFSPNSVKDVLVVAISGYNFEMSNDFDLTRDEKNEIKHAKFRNDISLKQGNSVTLQAKLNGEVGANIVQINIETTKGKRKASLDFNFIKDQRSPGDYNLDIKAKLNKHFVDVKSKVDVKGVHFLTDNSLSTSWGTQLTAKGEIGQRFTAQDIHIDLQGTFILTVKDKQGNWLLNIVGTPDRTNSDFKLSRDNVDLIVFSGETTHPQDKIASSKLNLQVKDLLGAKVDFKINKAGKGDLSALLNLRKAQRKINVDSKFTIASPKYDLETTITYDTDKKLFLKTENVIDKNKISTKNLLDINGDKILLDASGLSKGDIRLNGELDGKISLTTPKGRQIEGQFNRKITTAKNGISQGAMRSTISDKLPSNERRTLELSGNIDKLNVKTKEFSSALNLVYTNFAGKKLDITQNIKHLPNGNFKSIDYGIQLRGEIINVPIDIALIVDEYCPKHAIFRVSGKYGEQINSNLNGKYDLGDRAKPATYELQTTITAPQSNFKTYRLSTSGKYLRPETEEGTRSIEFHIDEQDGENTIKFNTLVEADQNHGSYSLDLSSSHLQGPLKLDGSFSRLSKDGGIGSQKYNINYSYGDKFIKTGLDLNYVESKSGVLHLQLDTAFDSIKNLDLVLRTTKADDTVEVDSELQLNGEKYLLHTSIFNSEHKKGTILKVILPQKTTTLSGFVELLGERGAKLTINIDNLGDLDLEYLGEVSLKAVDDLYITQHVNSRKLKIDKLDLDIRAEGSAGGKGVELSLKNAKGVIFAGSATYTVKKEKGKIIIEGQGQGQYYQKANNANFKIIYQLYDAATDQEVGYSFTFNGTFGPKNAVSTLKLTNKNLQAKVSVCEEKKQCTNVEIRSILSIDPIDVTSVQHDLMILIDLRELGYPHEFELQSKSSRKGFKFNHEIESNIISNNNIKYQLVASISPAINKIEIKLPSRQISIETEEVFPQGVFGHYQSSVTFYFDRLNKPNDVTKLIARADVSGVEKVAININSEIRFEHPTIRPLSVSGLLDANKENRVLKSELVFDIFRTPEQKITATSLLKNTASDGQGFNFTALNQVKSTELGLQYEAGGHLALSLEKQEFSAGYNVQGSAVELKFDGLILGNKDRIEILLSGLNEQLLNAVAEINRNKQSTKISANVQLLTLKPLLLVTEIEPNTAKIIIKRPGLFDATAEVKLGKEAKLYVKDGGKKLLSGRIALDAAHFLTTSFESNEEDTKAFLKSIDATIAEDTKVAKEQLQKRFERVREIIDRQAELAKVSAPDFTAFEADLKEKINEILKDLENDPAIKKFLENYHKYYETALKFYQDLAKTIIEAYEQIRTSVSELVKQFQAILKKTILPAWEEFSKKLTLLLSELQGEIVKLLTNFFEQALKSLKSFETDLKALGKPVYEVLKPIADSVQDLLQILVKDYEELVTDLREYLSKLPTFEALGNEIKEQIKKLKVVDEILSILRNVIDQLNNLSGTNESTELANKLYNYIEAKLRGTTVNDAEALEDLYNIFTIAVHSLWKRLTDLKPPKANYLTPIPISLELLSSLPAWISFRFSVLNFFINERLEDVASLIHLLKPPYDFLPPFNLVGHIADGKNVFTFDGRQFIFQGSCKYVLAQDADKNYFSTIATIKDGKLKTITLVDAKNFVEISDTGALKLNGKPVEFPVHVDDIHAWRRFYTLHLRTEYGVEVVCTTDLKVCHVVVDGFYTSKTRGLFGNGNAEPFDDFMTVEGKTAVNHGEFVNSYALSNCPEVTATELASVEHNQVCSELFGWDSSLMLGYLFFDRNLYRQACDEAVLLNPENKEETACNIALTYASGAALDNLPVLLPNRCSKCTGAAGQREIGDEFSVKIPTNKADIVFVVDLDSSKNIIENLVTPTITDLRNQLKTRGLTDVQIIVIAFSDDQIYPALLTSNGGKLNYNGKLSNFILNGPRRPEPLNVEVDIANEVLKWLANIQYQIGPQADENAFRLALDYPFRAGAAKSIVAVRSSQLEYTNTFKIIRAHLLSALTQFNGASLHMIAPVQQLGVDGVPAEKIVGFNSRIVATTDGKDVKKRQKLKFKNDLGIDFILQNNGWVFAAQNFDALNADDQKKAYLNQVTSSIADTLFKTDIISDCKCQQSYGLHAEHKCSIKSANFVPNKRPKGA